MYRWLSVSVLIIFLLNTQVQAAPFDHSEWDSLLTDTVRVLEGNSSTQVDYDVFSAKRVELQHYLKNLSAIRLEEFDSWSADEQLAFLINAYNSWTVELILTRYPDLASIKDLGSFFQSPWKKKFIPLFGALRSLDYIEQDLIRGSGRYNDPRIHFAVNCASIGCPALQPEAYQAKNLQHQLEAVTVFFLQDRSRNRFTGKRLEVSSIFRWYKKDFQKGWKSISSLQQFFASHAKDLDLNEKNRQLILTGKIKISFLNYNWQLNRTP